MDGQPAQLENPITPLNPPANPINRIFLISLGMLLIGFSLGVITWYILPFGKSSISSPSSSPQPTISEPKLPVTLSILTNPIVYEWRGSVKGTMTKKDEHTFTLVDEKGNSITITDLPPNGSVFKTTFFNKVDEDQQLITLKDIPLGSLMRGDFFIFKGGPNTPVGSVFVKE